MASIVLGCAGANTRDHLMRTPDQRTAIVSILVLLSVSASAGSLPITITNDNPDTILVTAYDMNLHPRAEILVGQRINGFASIPISVTPGPTGYGHISWSATSVDTFSRRCGHRDRPRLLNNAIVHVYAKSRCHLPQE